MHPAYGNDAEVPNNGKNRWNDQWNQFSKVNFKHFKHLLMYPNTTTVFLINSQ
jgi:hypothetical protein